MRGLHIQREKAGMTQAQLAKKLGVRPNTVWKWENDISNPSLNTIQEVTKIFNCTIDELINPTQPRQEETQAGEMKTI